MGKRRATGEGTVYRRPNGSWCAQITLPNGRRRTKYGRSQKVVNDWLLSQRQAIQTQTWVPDERMTVAEFLTRYLEDVAALSVRIRTLQSYRWLINRHVIPHLGSARLAKLTPPQVQRFYTGLLDTLSPTTILHIHNVLHRALDQAVHWGLVSRNITDLVSPPPVKRADFAVWTPAQVKAFLEAAQTHRLYALFVLAVYTGMRQGELLGLQVEDIDWQTGTLNIRHALIVAIGEKPHLAEPKSERSRRSIVLPAPALESLRQHVGAQATGFVFTSQVGTPLLPRSLTDIYLRLIEQAGVPRIRFHDLRHTCATLHLLAGTNPKVVQDLLGHSTISLTLDTYSHLLPSLQSDAATRLTRLLSD